jgi:flagellar basal body-associated protein FliL
MPLRLWVEKILYIIALAVFAVVASGTILAFASGRAKPGVGLRRAEPIPDGIWRQDSAQENASPGENAGAAGKAYAYTALGQIRVEVKPDPRQTDAQAVVVVSPWFLYPSDDSTFYEELSVKNRKLKAIVLDYFSQRTLDELLRKGEIDVKNDIVSLVNEELIMGKIPELFFDEYIFLD